MSSADRLEQIEQALEHAICANRLIYLYISESVLVFYVFHGFRPGARMRPGARARAFDMEQMER